MARKLFAALLVAASLFGGAAAAHADGLSFKNYTSETVYISVANFEAGGWRIDGWYEVAPRATVRIMEGKLDQRYYYYHAYTKSRSNVWQGNYNFETHPTNQFTILRVNGNYGALPAGHAMRGFRQVDTGEHRSYTVNLY
jgi:uncharacterized membrane protein